MIDNNIDYGFDYGFDYSLLIMFVSTTIVIAIMCIYINHAINKPSIIMNKNKRCVTIHKIKSKFSYAIVTENDQEQIITDQDKIKGLVNEAIYNNDLRNNYWSE